MNWRTAGIALALGAVAPVTVAAINVGQAVGPLGAPSAEMRTLCVNEPLEAGQVFALGGMVVLENHSADPIILDELRVVDPKGVEVVHSYVTPIRHRDGSQTAAGTGPVSPDDPEFTDSEDWRNKSELAGHVIDGHDQVSLFTLLAPVEGQPATFTGVHVSYRQGERPYGRDYPIAVSINGQVPCVSGFEPE